MDLAGLIDDRLTLEAHGANSATKALTVIGAMLSGGDSLDDVAALRAGANARVFTDTRAPSTIGSWLRAFRWHNVRSKPGAAFGYAKVRGYHPQVATCAETGQVLFSRLRGGVAGAARGAKMC